MIDPTRLLPADCVVDPDSFWALREAWAQRRTGHMCSPDGVRVPLVAGNLTRPGDVDLLASALCAPRLSLCSEELPVGGHSVPLGPLMFEAARRVAEPDHVREHLGGRVSEGPHYEATQHRLAIPGVTRALLSQVLRTVLTLREGLRAEGIGLGVVVDDLAALRALGVIRVDEMPPDPDDDSAPSGGSPHPLED